MLFGVVIAATAGAAFGTYGLIPSPLGILTGPALGAVVAATNEAFIEGFCHDSFSVRMGKTLLGALGGLFVVATTFGLFFGWFAVAWHLFDNPVTGPMIKWFPSTMGRAVADLLAPSIIAIMFLVFSCRVESGAVIEVRVISLSAMFGTFIGAGVESLFLIIIFPLALVLNDWHAGLWSGIAGAIVGGLYGSALGWAIRLTVSIWKV